MTSELPIWVARGVKVRLIEMVNDPCPIKAGTTGTIKEVVDLASIGSPGEYQLWMDWDPMDDQIRTLNLIWPADKIELV